MIRMRTAYSMQIPNSLAGLRGGLRVATPPPPLVGKFYKKVIILPCLPVSGKMVVRGSRPRLKKIKYAYAAK